MASNSALEASAAGTKKTCGVFQPHLRRRQAAPSSSDFRSGCHLRSPLNFST